MATVDIVRPDNAAPDRRGGHWGGSYDNVAPDRKGGKCKT